MPALDAHTRLVTLLGHPLGHTLSPLMHNTAFSAQGLSLVYLAMPVPPGDLPTVLAGMKALRVAGSNVTIPHKQAVLPFMDTLSEQARAVGAVNTIVPSESDGKVVWHGDNTDVQGFLTPMASLMPKLAGTEAVVFGSGGAARAVVYALLTHLSLSALHIVARSPGKAEGIAKDLARFDPGGMMHVHAVDAAGSVVKRSHLLINATPLGMHPYESASVWTQMVDFGPHSVAYDLVYNPQETQFMRDVRAAGGQSIGGLEMLIQQAAASYIQWTRQAMPIDAVRTALQAHLFGD